MILLWVEKARLRRTWMLQILRLTVDLCKTIDIHG